MSLPKDLSSSVLAGEVAPEFILPLWYAFWREQSLTLLCFLVSAPFCRTLKVVSGTPSGSMKPWIFSSCVASSGLISAFLTFPLWLGSFCCCGFFESVLLLLIIHPVTHPPTFFFFFFSSRDRRFSHSLCYSSCHYQYFGDAVSTTDFVADY